MAGYFLQIAIHFKIIQLHKCPPFPQGFPAAVCIRNVAMILLFLDTILLESAIIFYYNIKKGRITRRISIRWNYNKMMMN